MCMMRIANTRKKVTNSLKNRSGLERFLFVFRHWQKAYFLTYSACRNFAVSSTKKSHDSVHIELCMLLRLGPDAFLLHLMGGRRQLGSYDDDLCDRHHSTHSNCCRHREITTATILGGAATQNHTPLPIYLSVFNILVGGLTCGFLFLNLTT